MVTSGTQFFGYGSLVNLATHDYRNPRKATVQGWRRQWVYAANRNASFLSVTPDPQTSIQGMIADVTDLGWKALDAREAAYNRHALQSRDHAGVHIYQANPDYVDPTAQHKPILLSYIDCVIQGFLTHFGTDGVTGFFESTSGWERPIKDDRAEPIYPRAQRLSPDQTELVDHHLGRLAVTVLR
jgi:hypothetical protein